MATADIALALTLFFGLVTSLQIIFERANLTYQNSLYVYGGKLYINRHGRKSPYYFNLEGTTKHSWGNNISIHVLFFEYLHNEYRRSFMELHFKFCDMLRKDPYVGAMVAARGITCPAPPKHYSLLNMSVPSQNFPNLMPFKKCRADVDITITDGESIGKGNVYMTFIQEPKKTKTQSLYSQQANMKKIR